MRVPWWHFQTAFWFVGMKREGLRADDSGCSDFHQRDVISTNEDIEITADYLTLPITKAKSCYWNPNLSPNPSSNLILTQ